MSMFIAKIISSIEFVRSVSTNQVIEAFNDTFLGCSQGGINLFKEKLRKVVVCDGIGFGECVMQMQNPF